MYKILKFTVNVPRKINYYSINKVFWPNAIIHHKFGDLNLLFYNFPVNTLFSVNWFWKSILPQIIGSLMNSCSIQKVKENFFKLNII